jgi:predicted naringenin-chalcone synthase
MLLSDFKIIRPPHETSQEATLEWLIDAHTEAEIRKNNPDIPSFKKTLSEKLWHIGCKPDRIAKRGHVIEDYLHKNWDQMMIYRLDKDPSGRDLSARSHIFEEHTNRIFEEYYPEGSPCPNDLIHVSCTGYVSPSGAQKIASLKNWGRQTTITHAYHMGCYASIPAIRIASGFLALDPEKLCADIVHTEICSLHTNPANHNADQLVSQSLFADGFIKYSVKRAETNPHIRILAVQEEIIPNSTKSMTWNVMHWGFEMTLAKEIPVLISRALPQFLEHLAKKAKISLEHLQEKAHFAVHPGGPKILVYIQELLKLTDSQMSHSFHILKNYGNMSSATLPHIWESILNDPKIPDSTLIVSLAFGPGLSITGAIMEKKICGS